MTATYVYLVIFGCLSYLIVTDASVAKAVYFLSQIAKFQYEKLKWYIQHSPDNPIVKYFIWKRSYKLAKELKKEFEERNSK